MHMRQHATSPPDQGATPGVSSGEPRPKRNPLDMMDVIDSNIVVLASSFTMMMLGLGENGYNVSVQGGYMKTVWKSVTLQGI